MTSIFSVLKSYIPKSFLELVRPPYHFALAYISAVWYRHPSRSLTVIGVTGTKGKSTTTEIIAAILAQHGHSVASLSTIQFRINDTYTPNKYKMSMPGRFFVQRFLRQAVSAGCTHVVLEVTSEGAKQFRHRFLELDALVFTNLSPEHIESHGSFENYKNAKLSIRDRLVQSTKRPRYLVVNGDDAHAQSFLEKPVEHTLTYSLSDLTLHSLHKDSVSMVLDGVTMRAPLIGIFNVYNILAAVSLTQALGVSLTTAEKALRDLSPIKGRVERIETPKNYHTPFSAVVDYAHTPDSLEKLYQAFPDQRKICVLGNTGGGRDTWKRPEMAAIAERYCDSIILTNEDPYDENPRKILEDMERGITDKSKAEIIMDRRHAIATALAQATKGSVVLISGKGTDPYIMGPYGSKVPWSDAAVVTEEMNNLTTTPH